MTTHLKAVGRYLLVTIAAPDAPWMLALFAVALLTGAAAVTLIVFGVALIVRCGGDWLMSRLDLDRSDGVPETVEAESDR